MLPDLKKAKVIGPEFPENIERFEPDAVTPLDMEAASKIAAIKLPNIEANEKSTSLIVSTKSQRALVSYLAINADGQATTRLTMCDLKAGKVTGALALPTAAVPMGLSDSGDRIVVRFLPEAGDEQENHIEVWGWTNYGITREVRFLPRKDAVANSERPTYAAFLDDSRLATLTTEKLLTIWDWRNAKALMIFQKFQPFCNLTFSANKKYLFAFVPGSAVAAINTSNLSFAGWFTSNHWIDDCRISPSGTTLLTHSARVDPGGFTFRRLPEDRVPRSFMNTDRGLGRLLGLPSDEFALFEFQGFQPATPQATNPNQADPGLGWDEAEARRTPGSIVIPLDSDSNSFTDDPKYDIHRIDPTLVSKGEVALVDTKHGVHAWKYTGIDRLTVAGGQCWCLAQSQKGLAPTLVRLTMPGPELSAKVAQAVADPDYYLLARGGVVKLNLTGLPMADRAAASAVLEKRLKFRNVTVSAESDIELVAKTGPYRTRTLKTLRFIPNSDAVEIEKLSHRQLTVEVSILFKAQPVLKLILANDPELLKKRRNETSQQFYDRNPGTPAEVLETLNLPRVIFGPRGNQPLGSTNVAEHVPHP